jgi:hypothetical protein
MKPRHNIDIRRAGIISAILGVVFIGVMSTAVLWLGTTILSEPRKAMVVMGTVPPGVMVRVDGAPVKGNVRLKPGRHRVEVSREGKTPVSHDVDLEPGDAVTLSVDDQGMVRWSPL